MRSWLLAVLVTSVALAGCTEVPEGTQDTDSGADDPGDGNQTAPPGNATAAKNATNTAPVANLTADVLNGTAPLLVNLTINGTDADGDMLSWTLSNGTGNSTQNGTLANGTTLPATLNFTLEAGNHTFVLTISDGNATTTANLTIVVLPGQEVPTGPCGAEPEPCVVDEDTWVQFYSDGTCHMKEAYIQSSTGGVYINDRHNGQVGTGFVQGGGTWVYEEDNGIPGMQIGGPDESAEYTGCENPDHLIF